MNTAEFLFPSDLEITPLPLKRALFIGSCLSEAYLERLRARHPDATFDFVLYNNLSDLPAKSDDEIKAFDYQYLQLPLRSIITDAAVRIADFDREEGAARLLEVGRRNIDAMLRKALGYHERTGLLTLVSSFIVPQGSLAPSLKDARSPVDLCWIIDALNTHLARAIAPLHNVFLADVETIAATLGKRFFLDDVFTFASHGSVFYNNWHHYEADRIEPVPAMDALFENRIEEFFDAVFRQIENLRRSALALDAVKVVIFDLDNTIWRGQLVESYQDGQRRPATDGWPLGVWDTINQLRWRGIMVAICSKNDVHLVESLWDEVVQPPFLRLTDFIAAKIDWNVKSENIREILAQLSLTEQSCVFVDDNPVERAAVKAALPGIRTMGSNPLVTKRVLLWASETRTASRSEETRRRETMLQSQFERENQRASMSHDEFLQSLSTRVALRKIAGQDDRSFGRVVELLNKTNQFNTSGKRWTIEELTAFLAKGGEVYVFDVEDRFTSYGLVGIMIVDGRTIVQFVMSCRVLGMDVEVAALHGVVDRVRETRPGAITARIVHTASNTPCRTVFQRAGFKRGLLNLEHFELKANANVSRPSHVDLKVLDRQHA